VHQVIHQDNSEAEVVEKPAQLAFEGADSNGVENVTPAVADTKRDPQDSPPDQRANDISKGKDRNRLKKRKNVSDAIRLARPTATFR
jgi:hypothetical protein